VQRILDRVRVDRPVVATSETSERYMTGAFRFGGSGLVRKAGAFLERWYSDEEGCPGCPLR
jgi:hypothetical protein